MDTSLLIKQAKQGNAAAERCLFEKYADKMLLLCRRYLKSKEDAEEIMLDGFCNLFKNLSRFEYVNDSGLHAWIKKIMINQCLMFLRKKNVFSIVSETAAEDYPASDNVLNNLSAAEIFNLILQLPVGYRTVFNLYAIEGMEHKEIAALLKITEGTSKSQLSKARASLQKILLQNGIRYEGQKTK